MADQDQDDEDVMAGPVFTFINFDLRGAEAGGGGAVEDAEDDDEDPEDDDDEDGAAKRSWWRRASKARSLAVSCKSSHGELFKVRLGSGARGKCILFGDDWLTPSEFEAIAGKGSSKDWKKTIRYDGHGLQTLIEAGVLRPHAMSCTCASCCDDETAAGPPRLYVRQNRKKKTPPNSDGKKGKTDEQPNQANISGEDSDSQTLQNEDKSKEAPEVDNVMSSINVKKAKSNPTALIKKLDNLLNETDAYYKDFLSCVADMKKYLSSENREQEQTSSSYKSYDFPVTFECDATEKISNMLCTKCSRSASYECQLCGLAMYCSIDCQKGDWNEHQAKCIPKLTPIGCEPDPSIMIIVENQ